MQVLQSDIMPGEMTPNIATLLAENAKRYPDNIVISWREGDVYRGITWTKFYNDIKNISGNLLKYGFEKGDKVVVFSPNRVEMLQLELAVMASGGVSVPIFAYFNSETASLLINHSDARFLAVAGDLQLNRVDPKLKLKSIFVFDEVNNKRFGQLVQYQKLLAKCGDDVSVMLPDEDPDSICLNMYTSGTMGIPKCVQLTHRNILSQQAALSQIWKLNEQDRFLSYLPWHHSFGGIFERFTALCNGATIYLESGSGKDAKIILENWKLVKPTLFFSVPKVYQSLVELIKRDPSASASFFHPQLKFIFTAAASLPKNISDEFESRNIKVIEGWGLTETSPCCTLTDPSLKRSPGVVGKPIPGVSIRLADDGEIQVLGPNVMKGYYKNDEANVGTFTVDGWYCTGDIGEITEGGLKLISRKDRVFKLVNGEKVIPSDMEMIIQGKCHYISFALVVGSGQEYPVALLFPNKKMLDHPNYELSPEEGCFCPRTIDELGKCLHGCLHEANCGIGQKFSKIKAAMIIDDELSIEKNTITPSMKVAPKNVVNAYKAHLENLYGANNLVDEEVYIIKLDEETIRKYNLQA